MIDFDRLKEWLDEANLFGGELIGTAGQYGTVTVHSPAGSIAQVKTEDWEKLQEIIREGK